MNDYCCYILYSHKFNKTYVGYTRHLIQRFHSHNTLSPKGYTKKYRPWMVVYVEFFSSKSLAMKREKELKSGQGRVWVKSEVLSQYK